MKGIVFTEFLEMVESAHSADMVDELIEGCDLPSGGAYTAVGTYSHGEMAALVTRLSELTSTPVSELLKAFGRHLFARFTVLYPVFFEGRNDALEFLEGIDAIIHVEVLKLYPDAQLPRFDSRRPAADCLELVYRSDRHLGDLAEGLIQGCIQHFGGGLRVERSDLPEPGSPILFRIRPV